MALDVRFLERRDGFPLENPPSDKEPPQDSLFEVHIPTPIYPTCFPSQPVEMESIPEEPEEPMNSPFKRHHFEVLFPDSKMVDALMDYSKERIYPLTPTFNSFHISKTLHKAPASFEMVPGGNNLYFEGNQVFVHEKSPKTLNSSTGRMVPQYPRGSLKTCKRALRMFQTISLLTSSPLWEAEICARLVVHVTKREDETRVTLEIDNIKKLLGKKFTKMAACRAIVIGNSKNTQCRVTFYKEWFSDSLYDCLKKEDFTLKQRIIVAVQLLEIVLELHSMRLAYNDLKPKNILVRFNGDQPSTVLGEVESVTDAVDKKGEFISSDGYRPSNYKIERDRRKVDIWSLGIILLEILCYIKKPKNDQLNGYGIPAELKGWLCQMLLPPDGRADIVTLVEEFVSKRDLLLKQVGDMNEVVED